MRPFLVAIATCGFLVSALAGTAWAQGGTAPAPDIFVVGLRTEKGSVALAGNARNVSRSDSYDNQPSWAPDGRSIFFTSTRDGAQADIYRVDVASDSITRVTRTDPESEYSATVTPDRRALSVIRVERDSTQRLWRFPLDGSEPSVLLPTVKPAGYHAWADDHTIALFVLGTPNSLVLADVRTQHVDTVVHSIGRSLHRIPGTARISFVSKISDSEWWIVDLDPRSRTMKQLARLPAGVEDYDWTPDGKLLAGEGSRLLRWSGTTWETVADLASQGLSQITRLSVSPRGDRLAIVAVPAR